MTTVSYEKHHCPVSQALAQLGDQWTLLIVRDVLILGQRRFNELQESIGISRNLLTRRLAQLCDAGILERVRITGSKRRAYAATQKCRDLEIVVMALAKWGEKWGTDPHIHYLALRETATGRPVTIEFVQTDDGKVVDPDNVTVQREGNEELQDAANAGFQS